MKKMNNEMIVDVVVVTYNRKDMLVRCLDAILNQTYKVRKIILIDNDSTDGTRDFIKEKGYLNNTSIYYLKLQKNIGGAGGFHEGIKLARNMQSDWVWIMDDDVIPNKDCLEELLKADQFMLEKVSFYASAIRNLEGQAMNVPKIDKNQYTQYIDWYQHLDKGLVKIVKATFVSILINGKAIKKCGLPWSPFFIWGDDSEYTQRLIRDYGPAYMVGSSKAVHLRNSAEELSIVNETNINRIQLYYYLYRNNLIGFWEYETTLYKALCVGKLGLDFFRVLFKGKHRWRKMIVIVRAFLSFVFGSYDKKSFNERGKI